MNDHLLKQKVKVPDGWKLKSVGQACKIRNDLRKPISVEERAKMKGVFPYYGPTGILGYINEYLADGNFALIGEDGDHFLKFKDKEQTLLVGGKFNVNNHAHIIEATDSCTIQWFYHFFKHRNVKSFLSRQGAGRYKLNKETLKKLPILLPPLPEQTAIADLLSTWDTAIKKTERLIAAKENLFAAYRQQLFQSKKAIEKNGWAKVRLSDCLSEHGELSSGDEKVFSVSVHKSLINQIEHLGRSFSANNTSNYNRVHFGDLVYTKSPTGNFPYGIVKQSTIFEDVIVSPLYGVFTPQTIELGTILDFYFESPITKECINL